MTDLIANISSEWIVAAIKYAPVIAVLLWGAWDLRKQLVECQRHNQELFDRFLERELSEDSPD